MSDPHERRVSSLRRDLNDVVRSPDGSFSFSKVSTYSGQILCGYLLIKHAETILQHSDALAVILCGMMLPELLKKLLIMKMGGKDGDDKH